MRAGAPLCRDDVLVVSGGGRGITAHCAVGLARAFGSAFLLLGRTPLDKAPEPDWAAGCDDQTELRRRYADEALRLGTPVTPAQVEREVSATLARRAIAATLAAIVRAGGRAEYLCADITDQAALAGALPAVIGRLGPATGIIHGAGVLADRRIEHKTSADFARVYAAKVQGLEHLLAALPPERLRYLILFSSVAAFYGNIGQAEYAIANEVLNKAAYHLRARLPQTRVIAINWGPWDGGMVSAAHKALFAERRVALVSVEAGVRALIDELEGGAGAAQVILGAEPGRATPRPPAPGTLRAWRRVTPAEHVFLADHRIGGSPVLPTICAAGWMAHIGEAICPGYMVTAIEALQVLKGVVFDGSEAPEYALELTVPAASPGEPLQLDALIWSAGANGAQRYHFRGRLTLAGASPAPPRVAPPTPASGAVVEGAQLYRSGALFHGPAFQGIERVLTAEPSGLTMRCRLPGLAWSGAGPFDTARFDSIAADVAIQGLVIWAFRFYGAAGLPLRIARVEVFGRPAPGAPFTIDLTVGAHDERRAVGDLIAYDDDGAALLRIWGAELTLSKHMNRLFVPAPSLAPTS